MADEKDLMRLTDGEKKKIVAFLKSKGSRGVCPKCGHKTLLVGEHLVVSPIFSPKGGMSLGGKVYPMAMLICENCYHVDYHMVVPMGALDKPEAGNDAK